MKTSNALIYTFVAALTTLTLQGCTRAGTSNDHNYSEEFAWEALMVEQAYDARDPKPVFGWAKRTLDFEHSTAMELQVLCYPGYDALKIETYVDQQASWVRDLTGALYGKAVYQEQANFDLFASGNAPVHFGTEPTRKEVLQRSAHSGEVNRPQWVPAYSESRNFAGWMVEEIAPGLLLVSMGGQDARNLLAVPGKTGWIIIGQSFNDFGYMRDAYTALKEHTGNGEVEAVFADHTHLDHYDVSNYFINLGAKLIVNETALGQLAARNIEPEAASLITFSGLLKYKAADTTVEFHEVPNSHSMGLGLAWLPDFRVAYQGDAFSLALDGTPAPANTLTRELAAYLNDHNIEFERLVGNHQSNRITWQEFNTALQMSIPTNNPDLPDCEEVRDMLD